MSCGEMYENRNLVDINLSKYAGSKSAASLNRLAFDAITQLKYCDFTEMTFSDEPETPPEEGGDESCQSETQ